jgi:hypothetical protein
MRWIGKMKNEKGGEWSFLNLASRYYCNNNNNNNDLECRWREFNEVPGKCSRSSLIGGNVGDH